MTRRVFPVKRPEGGAERYLALYTHHRCPEMVQAEMKGTYYEDLDLLQFAYGLIGWEQPLDMPFEVVSTLPCEACVKYVRAMFVWVGPKVLFTP